MEKILDNHLMKEKTIKEVKCPRSYELLQIHHRDTDGFELLERIIKDQNSALGGRNKDPEELVALLDTYDGEKVSSYYSRTMDVYNNIKIHRDRTGQCNKVIGKFCETLCDMNSDFKLILHSIYVLWYEFKVIN